MYNTVLKEAIEPALGKTTTYSDDLEKMGKALFSSKFIGVFPKNKIPDRTGAPQAKRYMIANLDNNDEPGSHWVSIIDDLGERYLYDSFGRKPTKILPNADITKSSDLDSEQHLKEKNCGARCMAFIAVYDEMGKLALYI
jgi:hypothetical protein